MKVHSSPENIDEIEAFEVLQAHPFWEASKNDGATKASSPWRWLVVGLAAGVIIGSVFAGGRGDTAPAPALAIPAPDHSQDIAEANRVEALRDLMTTRQTDSYGIAEANRMETIRYLMVTRLDDSHAVAEANRMAILRDLSS